MHLKPWQALIWLENHSLSDGLSLLALGESHESDEILAFKSGYLLNNLPHSYTDTHDTWSVLCVFKGPATSGSSNKGDQNSIEENPALKCSFCGKQCLKKDSLTRHMRIHNRDHTCKQCPFTTKIYKAFLEHRKKEHASVYKCSICDFSTTRYDNLRRHMSGHEKPHKCPECKFSTSRLQNLQKHIKNKHEKK